MQISTIDHPIKQIHQANLLTVGKFKQLEDIDWKKVNLHQLFLGEHSTLEWVPIYIYAPARKDVTTHIVRHTKQHPRFVVQSGRPDWTGKERPPYDAQTLFMMMVNPLSLISMAKQRLCFKAMKETREWMEEVVLGLYLLSLLKDAQAENSNRSETESDLLEQATFFRTLSEILVPDCVYRGQCCQAKSCGMYQKQWQESTLPTRYAKYHSDLRLRGM